MYVVSEYNLFEEHPLIPFQIRDNWKLKSKMQILGPHLLYVNLTFLVTIFFSYLKMHNFM